MKIKVKYFAFFKDLVGQNEEVVELNQGDFCVRDLIHLLSEKYGATFNTTLINTQTNQVREGCVLLLNNTKGDLDQRIKDRDVISLLPILAGG